MTGLATARRWARHSVLTARFVAHYTWLFLLANLKVAWTIIAPRRVLAPAVVVLRLRARTPLEIMLIVHLINLTPGTVVVDLRPDLPVALVHGMHAADPVAFQEQLRDLERRLLAVLRPGGGGSG